MPCNDDDYVTCVRRFGRAERGPGEFRGNEHITGARMAQTNGHEVCSVQQFGLAYNTHTSLRSFFVSFIESLIFVKHSSDSL